MLAARELNAQGLSVRLIERGDLGHEASWAGGGILSPLYPWRYPDPVTRLASYGQARYAGFARQLYEESGIDPEWEPSGLLMPGLDEFESARYWAKKHCIEIEALEADAVSRYEPALNSHEAGAIWMPGVAQIRNPRLVRALRVGLTRGQIDVETNNPVTGFRVENGQITGVNTQLGFRESDQVVLAGGAWSDELLKPIGQSANIRPVRGQMVVFKGYRGQLGRIVLRQNRYLIPRRDGRIVVGSTLEEVGFDNAITSEAYESLTHSAIELVPSLANLPVEKQWSGLRPGSTNGIPVIAEHPDIKGLYINTGHYRNGVVLALGSTRVLSDLILGHSPLIEPKAYAYPA